MGPQKERWRELCAQAAVEHDPKKLIALTTEICRLLEEEQHPIRGVEPSQNTHLDSADAPRPQSE